MLQVTISAYFSFCFLLLPKLFANFSLANMKVKHLSSLLLVVVLVMTSMPGKFESNHEFKLYIHLYEFVKTHGFWHNSFIRQSNLHWQIIVMLWTVMVKCRVEIQPTCALVTPLVGCIDERCNYDCRFRRGAFFTGECLYRRHPNACCCVPIRASMHVGQ